MIYETNAYFPPLLLSRHREAEVSWLQNVRSGIVLLKNRISLYSTNCSKMGLTVFIYPSISSTHHMTTYAVHTHKCTRTSMILIFAHTTQVQWLSRDDRTPQHCRNALTEHRLIERPLTTASQSQLVFTNVWDTGRRHQSAPVVNGESTVHQINSRNLCLFFLFCRYMFSMSLQASFIKLQEAHLWRDILQTSEKRTLRKETRLTSI